jgi:hypothetical protein
MTYERFVIAFYDVTEYEMFVPLVCQLCFGCKFLVSIKLSLTRRGSEVQKQSLPQVIKLL